MPVVYKQSLGCARHQALCASERARVCWWHRIRSAKPKTPNRFVWSCKRPSPPGQYTKSNADWFINRSARNHFTYSEHFSPHRNETEQTPSDFFWPEKCDGGCCQSKPMHACFTLQIAQTHTHTRARAHHTHGTVAKFNPIEIANEYGQNMCQQLFIKFYAAVDVVDFRSLCVFLSDDDACRFSRNFIGGFFPVWSTST